MGKTKERRRHGRWSPFRIAILGMGIGVAALLLRLPTMSVQAEKVKEELAVSADDYYKTQETYNRLNSQLAEVDTSEFIERIARRELGYCWYGETIYTVINIADLEENISMDVFAEEEAIENEEPLESLESEP